MPSALSFMSLQMPTTRPMPSASRRKQPVVVNESILPGVLDVSRMVPPYMPTSLSRRTTRTSSWIGRRSSMGRILPSLTS